MLVRLPQLDITRLAADYSAAVRGAHTALELAAITDRNARETDAAIDHVHDYCDANDLMADAVALQLGHVDDWSTLAADMTLAQSRAKAAQFKLSRILIACEFSGRVRDAFAAQGHSVTSCDFEPTETAGNHYRGDVRDIIGDGWHMMLAFPDCTYLTGSQLWRCNPKHDPTRERAAKSDAALEFVRDLLSVKIDRVALENPRGRIGSDIRKADQEIHPYQFGDDASKTTGLWLKNLDCLPIPPRERWIAPRVITYKGKQVNRWANQSPCGADNKSPGPDRWKDRSRTYPGIVRAMAATWGQLARIAAPLLAATQLELFPCSR